MRCVVWTYMSQERDGPGLAERCTNAHTSAEANADKCLKCPKGEVEVFEVMNTSQYQRYFAAMIPSIAGESPNASSHSESSWLLSLVTRIFGAQIQTCLAKCSWACDRTHLWVGNSPPSHPMNSALCTLQWEGCQVKLPYATICYHMLPWFLGNFVYLCVWIWHQLDRSLAWYKPHVSQRRDASSATALVSRQGSGAPNLRSNTVGADEIDTTNITCKSISRVITHIKIYSYTYILIDVIINRAHMTHCQIVSILSICAWRELDTQTCT